MPRIYVADLAAYNAGYLHGKWFDPADFDYDADELHSAVQEMLEDGHRQYAAATLSEKHEEWAIHDYEEFDGVQISEWQQFDFVCELAQALDDKGEAFGLFVSHFGLEISDAVSAFDEAYIGDMSLEDYAYNLVEECYLPELSGGSKEFFESYFDYDKFARDLKLGGDVVEISPRYDAHYLFDGNW